MALESATTTHLKPARLIIKTPPYFVVVNCDNSVVPYSLNPIGIEERSFCMPTHYLILEFQALLVDAFVADSSY
jgi:hypothetical protein